MKFLNFGTKIENNIWSRLWGYIIISASNFDVDQILVTVVGGNNTAWRSGACFWTASIGAILAIRRVSPSYVLQYPNEMETKRLLHQSSLKSEELLRQNVFEITSQHFRS